MAKASKAHMRATAKWEKKAYDAVYLRLRKGELDSIRHEAARDSLSVNAWISAAIRCKLADQQRDDGAPEAPDIGGQTPG